MSGELADCFRDREEGVGAVVALRVQYRGYTDGESLRSEELVYTGAIRTAVADRVPFAGEW